MDQNGKIISSLIQNSPAVKESVQPSSCCEKRCEIKLGPRNGCDGMLMTKFLLTTAQVNLVLGGTHFGLL